MVDRDAIAGNVGDMPLNNIDGVIPVGGGSPGAARRGEGVDRGRCVGAFTAGSTLILDERQRPARAVYCDAAAVDRARSYAAARIAIGDRDHFIASPRPQLTLAAAIVAVGARCRGRRCSR